MIEWIFTALAAGLSVGVFCLSNCFPFVASYLIQQERSFRETVRLLTQLIIGRLFGYLSFGAVFGFLGERLTQRLYHRIADSALILLSAMLLFATLKSFRAEKMKSSCPACSRSFSPLGMGFLLGINLCPPFLLSLSYVFSLQSMTSSILYFFLFFLSSSVYFLPFLFAGTLSHLKEFRAVARISGWVTGILFLFYGLYSLYRNG